MGYPSFGGGWAGSLLLWTTVSSADCLTFGEQSRGSPQYPRSQTLETWNPNLISGKFRPDSSASSEPAAQGDEDFAMAGVAYGDAEGYETEGRVADEADGSVLAQKRTLLG